MEKTENELSDRRQKISEDNKAFRELTEEELFLISGGVHSWDDSPDFDKYKPINGDVVDYC